MSLTCTHLLQFHGVVLRHGQRDVIIIIIIIIITTTTTVDLYLCNSYRDNLALNEV
jgi:hypothetical protein